MTKFAKVLASQQNPKWKGKYVQYKRLKRVIGRIIFERDEESKEDVAKHGEGCVCILKSNPLGNLIARFIIIYCIWGGGQPSFNTEA
jgi:hypothetical protein